MAIPVLEKYHQKCGHYPDSFDQLGLGKPAPSGLLYHKDNGSYSIDYYDVHYWGDDDWSVPD
ncbi:MAG TPA: hypothetical protein VL981_13075 [Candidatus Methylacidiphilales bacterium]|nr:hypothetical protein [Candidatus Methylacidiphilales bacterium]